MHLSEKYSWDSFLSSALAVFLLFTFNPLAVHAIGAGWSFFSAFIFLALSVRLFYFCTIKARGILFVWWYLFLVLAIYVFLNKETPSWFGISFIIYALIINESQEFIHDSFIWIRKIFSTLACLSFVAFILITFGLQPSSTFQPLGEGKQAMDLHYDNYYWISVVLSNQYFDVYGLRLHRLHMLFDEPGMVGTLSALLLASSLSANLKDKHNAVFLISGFLSFSFSFYVLISLYFLARLASFGKTSKYVALGAFIVFSFFLSVNIFEGLQNSHTERFVLNKDLSELDNRTLGPIDDKFWSVCQSTYNCMFGFGAGIAKDIDSNGSSFKYGVIDYGYFFLFSAVLILTLSLLSRYGLRYEFIPIATPLGLLYFANFYQRPVYFNAFLFLFFAFPLLRHNMRSPD